MPQEAGRFAIRDFMSDCRIVRLIRDANGARRRLLPQRFPSKDLLIQASFGINLAAAGRNTDKLLK